MVAEPGRLEQPIEPRGRARQSRAMGPNLAHFRSRPYSSCDGSEMAKRHGFKWRHVACSLSTIPFVDIELVDPLSIDYETLKSQNPLNSVYSTFTFGK